MAKGDHKRAEDNLKSQQAAQQTSQNKVMDSLQSSRSGFANNYNQGAGMNLTSYDDIMKGYQSLYQNPFGTNPDGSAAGGGASGYSYNDPYGQEYAGYQKLTGGDFYSMDPEFRGALSKSIGGYGNFADTGGFSGQDIQDMRARAIAPTRAAYQNAQNDVDRARSLGGNSANYNASKAKMTRELAYELSDANTNANAGIAQMVQQGKLAGLGGLVSAGGTGQGLQNDINSLNGQLMLAGLGGMTGIDSSRAAGEAAAANSRSSAASQNAEDMYRAKMGALGGMTDLYGTNPALLNATGNHLLASDQNLLAGNAQQQGLSGQMMNGYQGLSQIQGNFGSAMDNVGKGLEMAGRVAGAVGSFGMSEAIPAIYKNVTSGNKGVPNTGGLGAVNMGGGATNGNPFQTNPFVQSNPYGQQNPYIMQGTGFGGVNPFQTNPFAGAGGLYAPGSQIPGGNTGMITGYNPFANGGSPAVMPWNTGRG